MEGVADELLIAAASQMAGIQRRIFLAEVCRKLCDGNTRQAERRFGWGRNTIAKGIEEQKLDPDALATRKSGNAGKKRSEEQNPQLAIDIRLIVEPHTQTDAIFENVQAVRTESEADPETLEISIDTKTKVKLGEYLMGGKNADRF